MPESDALARRLCMLWWSDDKEVAEAWDDGSLTEREDWSRVAEVALSLRPPRVVDGFLSRKVQAVWPLALVWQQGGEWIVAPDQDGGELGLGQTFHAARQGVAALVAAMTARRTAHVESSSAPMPPRRDLGSGSEEAP